MDVSNNDMTNKLNVSAEKIKNIDDKVAVDNDDKVNDSKYAFVGKPAPKFISEAWTGSNFKVVNLNDYKGKYLIIRFYERNFEESIIEEINLYSDNFDLLNKLSNFYIYLFKIVLVYLFLVNQNIQTKNFLLIKENLVE